MKGDGDVLATLHLHPLVSILPALDVSEWVDPTTHPIPWNHSLGLVCVGRGPAVLLGL